MSEPLPDASRVPHPDRLHPGHPRYAEILRAHDAAVARDEPCYVDPATGFTVLTAAFLWDRGTCCTNGCRHCPYVDRDGPG